jgi:hypothetical protein
VGVEDGFNVSTDVVEVYVPHSRMMAVVDDGAAFTVNGCTPVAPAGTVVASATGKGGAEEETASQDK